MNIVSQRVEVIPQLLSNVHIARCARICYGKGVYDELNVKKADKLVDELIKRGHFSMLRHATSYYAIHQNDNSAKARLARRIATMPYVHSCHSEDILVIAINHQWIFEHQGKARKIERYRIEMIDIPQTHKDVERVTMAVTTQIAVTRELNRVSPNAIAEQSTRYVDLAKSGVPISLPHWCGMHKGLKGLLLDTLLRVCTLPYKLARKVLPPEDARYFLPLGTQTTAVYTYTRKEWEHILDLRLHGTTGKPHPDAKDVASQIKQLLK